MEKQSWFKTHWKTGVGITMILAAVIVLIFSIGTSRKSVSAENATLGNFMIVAGEGQMEQARQVYIKIAEETGILLPVVEEADYSKGHAIFVGAQEFNSYGGYRYRISTQTNENTANIYLDGSGASLTAAASKLIELYKKDETAPFPFGIEEAKIGYEWNTTDSTMTGLGYEMTDKKITELGEGVSLVEMKYKSLALGKTEANVVIVKAGADARMVVSAAQWDETNSVANPVQLYTTGEHGAKLVEQGYDVLAISNAGYFKKQEGSNLPWGMQIIDGEVKQEPNASEPKYTSNWFGVTKDDKYVISDLEGYNTTYKGNLQYAVGGHLIMMKNGVPCHISGTPHFRTAVGINDAGDLVILTMDNINYAAMIQVFMDLDMDIHTVLNLDGGGSSTLYCKDSKGQLKQYACGESPLERPVMDTIAIVVGKQS